MPEKRQPVTKKLPEYKMPDRSTKMKSKVNNSIAEMYKKTMAAQMGKANPNLLSGLAKISE